MASIPNSRVALRLLESEWPLSLGIVRCFLKSRFNHIEFNASDGKAGYDMAKPPFNLKAWRADDELTEDPWWSG